MYILTYTEPASIIGLIGDLPSGGSVKYLFLSVIVVTFGYIIVWGQTRNLYKIRRVLKEREEVLREVASQREELAYKNKNITDSLVYAQRIQEALIPTQAYFEKHFNESFILFRPRDIVSGDFYYISKKKNRTYIVVADCTGHGVPGALMSMIGLQTLSRIIEGGAGQSPAHILDRLNLEIESVFHREDDGAHSVKDGMDIAVCCLDRQSAILEFAGSFLPLYLVRNGKMTEYKGDKIVIGRKPDGHSYTNITIEVEDDDAVYMVTDGYADQFGGTGNKKFMNRRLRYMLTTIHKYPFRDQKEILEENIITWMGENEQVDDIMLIGFRI
jgi:serine phosphatase RsbU (regulator of sigma subunit)